MVKKLVDTSRYTEGQTWFIKLRGHACKVRIASVAKDRVSIQVQHVYSANGTKPDQELPDSVWVINHLDDLKECVDIKFNIGDQVQSTIGSAKFVVTGYELWHNRVVVCPADKSIHERNRWSYRVHELDKVAKFVLIQGDGSTYMYNDMISVLIITGIVPKSITLVPTEGPEAYKPLKSIPYSWQDNKGGFHMNPEVLKSYNVKLTPVRDI